MGEARSAAVSGPGRATALAEPVAAVLAPALAALALARYGLTGEGALAAAFTTVLVVLASIDLKEHRLPNRIVFPSIAVALAWQGVLHPDRMIEWLAAGAGASLFFLVPQLVYRGGVGMGDVKLAFLIGLVLGQAVIPAIFIATVSASVAALAVLVVRGRTARKAAIPYGPFLAAGAALAILTDIGSPF